jgi:hypothetical protein
MDSPAHQFQERTMTRALLVACVFGSITAVASFACAQGFGSRFGTSGSGSSGFSSSSFRSGFGSSGFGSSGFGSSGFGSSGFGSSAFGSGFGSSGFGSSFGSGFGGMSGFGSSGFGSSGFGNSFGNSGFGSGFGGQNFVGRDSADMANTWNQMGQAGAQFFNQMNRSMSRGVSNAQSAPVKVKYVPQELRVNLQVAFTPPRPSQAELAETIRTRLGRILAVQNIAAPQLTMEGDVAVLGGVAATESQRLVLEHLVAMEPGVRAVRNEMTVVAPSATESLSADRN